MNMQGSFAALTETLPKNTTPERRQKICNTKPFFFFKRSHTIRNKPVILTPQQHDEPPRKQKEANKDTRRKGGQEK